MDAFRKQCSRQLTAAIAAALLFPLHASAAIAGLNAMNEADLDAVSARGLTDDLLSQSTDTPGAKVIGKLTSSLDKRLTFLDMETTLSDVSYDPARARTFVNADGSLTQILPNSIGELSLDRIRVKGAAPDASFGSISIRAIDFNRTSLILAPRR